MGGESFTDHVPGVPARRLRRAAAELYLYSLQLLAEWLVALPREPTRIAGWREALRRIILPLDLWRYAELPLVASDGPRGRILDIGSPKLLGSLARRRGAEWEVIDLDPQEVREWRALDPALPVTVADGTELPFGDATFDSVVCISVIEHIPEPGDMRVLQEVHRVLRAGGRLFLTTPITPERLDVHVDEPVFGEATAHDSAGWFFERRLPLAELMARVEASGPWEVERLVTMKQRRPRIQRAYWDHIPWSHLTGPFLWAVAWRGFLFGTTQPDTGEGDLGVAYLCLRRDG